MRSVAFAGKVSCWPIFFLNVLNIKKLHSSSLTLPFRGQFGELQFDTLRAPAGRCCVEHMAWKGPGTQLVTAVRLERKTTVLSEGSQSQLWIILLFLISSSCKKCDPVEIELGGETYQAQQSNSCNEPETCYTYNRDKCYTTTFPFVYHGETKHIQAALTPTSCYAE